MNKRYWLLILLLCTAPWLRGQGIFEGEWLGTLVQPDNPPYENYTLRLEMHQEGNIVTGFTNIHLEGHPEIYARMEFRAAAKGRKLMFREHTLLDHFHFATYEWCLKRGILTLEEAGEDLYQMTGVWEGFTDEVACSPGYMVVERIDPISQEDSPPVAIQKVEPAKKNEPVKKEKDEVVDPEAGLVYGDLNGRAITRMKTVPVYQGEVTAYVWDVNREDGDIISLSFNGEWILKDYPLKKKKHAVKIKVEPGKENRLVLFAENLGEIPPNTCALTFYDGKQRRNLSLISDKVSCGALKFVLKEE